MSTAKKLVTQTNRTILFEQFNEQKPNLLQYVRMNSTDNMDSETMNQKIMELEVRSFDEFLEKFSPVIYEYARPGANGEVIIDYKLRKENPNDNVAEIKLADSPYFITLCKIYAKRGESGDPNYKFDYDKILEDLLPAAEAKRIRNLRCDLNMLGQLYFEKKARNEDASRENEKMKKFFEEIKATYSKSELPLLPLRMEENNEKIKAIDEYIKTNTSNGKPVEGRALPPLGSFAFDANGRVTIVPLPAPEARQSGAGDGRLAIGQQLNNALVKRIGNDYARTKAEGANPRVRDLVVTTFTDSSKGSALATSVANIEEAHQYREVLMQEQKAYNKIYTSARNSFIQALQNVAAKILNVKVFFDHATAEGSAGGELPRGAGLIVANCAPEELIATDELKSAFKGFLETFNTNPMEKIWFGILPNVLEVEKDSAGDNRDWDDEEEIVIEVDGGAAKPESKGMSFTSACEFLKLMDEVKVLTAFNFKPDKNINTFAALKPRYIKDTKKKLDRLSNNAHAMLAYPNFHLMQGKVKPVVENITLDAYENERDYNIYIDDVYISSAYVAAGLLAASQQADPFKKIGLDSRLLKDNPNVHVDLENPEVSIKFLPRFSRELALNWPPRLKDEINNSPYGFVFCGDPRFDKQADEYLKKVYIYLARTLFQKQDSYQPIYTTLVKDFIDLCFKGAGEKVDRNFLKNFMKEDVRQWKEQANRDPKMLNLILGLDDDISQDPKDPGTLHMNFGPVEDTLAVNVVDG